jgi:hypothetical protein
MSWALRRLSRSDPVKSVSGKSLLINTKDGSPPASPTLSSPALPSHSPTTSSPPASPTPPAVELRPKNLRRTDNFRRLSSVLSKLHTTRRPRSELVDVSENELAVITPMVAKFEVLDTTPTPCFVDYEEVKVSPVIKSARRRSYIEQVDTTLFTHHDIPEQHATDKMVKAREILMATREESSRSTVAAESDSEFEDDDDEKSYPLADFKPSIIKSSLSL